MTIKEKINILKSSKLCAKPTVITQDMGIEFVVITSQGAGTGFGDMGQWPCFKFSIDEKLKEILLRVSNGNIISIDEIRKLNFCKELCKIHDLWWGNYSYSEEDIVKILKRISKDLWKISADNQYFYAFSTWNGVMEEPVICSTYEQLCEVFLDNYSYLCNDYDSMDEEDIEMYYSYYDETGDNLSLFDRSEKLNKEALDIND